MSNLSSRINGPCYMTILNGTLKSNIKIRKPLLHTLIFLYSKLFENLLKSNNYIYCSNLISNFSFTLSKRYTYLNFHVKFRQSIVSEPSSKSNGNPYMPNNITRRWNRQDFCHSFCK